METTANSLAERQAFGRMLRQARKTRNLSQGQLASALNRLCEDDQEKYGKPTASQSTVSAWESGTRIPSRKQLTAIGAILEISESELGDAYKNIVAPSESMLFGTVLSAIRRLTILSPFAELFQWDYFAEKMVSALSANSECLIVSLWNSDTSLEEIRGVANAILSVIGQVLNHSRSNSIENVVHYIVFESVTKPVSRAVEEYKKLGGEHGIQVTAVSVASDRDGNGDVNRLVGKLDGLAGLGSIVVVEPKNALDPTKAVWLTGIGRGVRPLLTIDNERADNLAADADRLAKLLDDACEQAQGSCA